MTILPNLTVVPDDMAGRVRTVASQPPALPCGSDILVRMMYAPINPADLLVIDGRYAFALDRNEAIGAEGAGIVAAVGPAVSDLKPGDPVLLLSRGNWCRYRMVSRSDLMPLPMPTDMEQGAMLRINPPTAHLLLERAGVRAGDVIVQNGATSTVAHWVRLIAAQRGITVINVVRRADPALPDAIVDGPGLADRVKQAAAGLPIRAAFDCVAGAASGRLAECLMPGGQLTVFGHLSGDPITVRSQLLTGGDVSICGFSLRPAEAALDDMSRNAMFASLFALHRASGMTLPVRDIFSLSQIDDAIMLARRAGSGRVLIDLTP